jgi:hypothetical protein
VEFQGASTWSVLRAGGLVIRTYDDIHLRCCFSECVGAVVISFDDLDVWIAFGEVLRDVAEQSLYFIFWMLLYNCIEDCPTYVSSAAGAMRALVTASHGIRPVMLRNSHEKLWRHCISLRSVEGGNEKVKERSEILSILLYIPQL